MRSKGYCPRLRDGFSRYLPAPPAPEDARAAATAPHDATTPFTGGQAAPESTAVADAETGATPLPERLVADVAARHAGVGETGLPPLLGAPRRGARTLRRQAESSNRRLIQAGKASHASRTRNAHGEAPHGGVGWRKLRGEAVSLAVARVPLSCASGRRGQRNGRRSERGRLHVKRRRILRASSSVERARAALS